MFTEVNFSATRLHMEPGDLMFLYTDGLLEAQRGDEEYGVDRVTNVLRRKAACCPADAITSCLEDLRSFMDSQPLDDLTLLAIQRSSATAS